MLNKSITVGDIKARSPIALAPMAGVADVPFRQLAWELGAGYMVSEMISSSDHLWDTDKNRMRRVALSGVFPNVIQIAGCDPKALSESARKVVDEGADIVDINFGCPAKKVCKKLAGSALLDDIALIGCIVEAVAKAVPVPVTIKTRTGITPDDHLGIQAAKIAQESGAQMVVIHSRSRSCRFKGIVDHRKVAELKSILSIPFLVNGDICSEDSAKTALEESLADGVMLGRGAVGQPWIFRELAGKTSITLREKWNVMERHVHLAYEFYGMRMGLKMMRKHIKAYLINLGCGDLIRAAMSIDEPSELTDFLGRRDLEDRLELSY